MIALLTNQNSQQALNITLNTQLETLEAFLTNYHHKNTSTVIGKSIHLRSIESGFEIEYQEGKIHTFFAYFRTPKMGLFSCPFLYGINKNWTIKTAVYYFGEPATKSAKMVEIMYPHLGLGLVFQGSYNNEDSPIDYVYVFKKEGSRCASCLKEALMGEWLRCECDCVAYCSKECKSKHYGTHLMFCQLNC